MTWEKCLRFNVSMKYIFAYKGIGDDNENC